MWKKIWIIVAGVVVVGLLVVGALFRTGVVLARQVSQAGNGNGILQNIFDRNDDQNDCNCGQENRQSFQGPMENRGRGNMNNNGKFDDRDQANGRNNWQNKPSNEQGAGQAPVEEWVTIEGKVSAVDSTTLTVTAADGARIQINPRAWRYAQAQDFSASTGDEVSILGFYDNETFEAGKITNVTSGQSVELREDNGRPLWAGGGRGRD